MCRDWLIWIHYTVKLHHSALWLIALLYLVLLVLHVLAITMWTAFHSVYDLSIQGKSTTICEQKNGNETESKSWFIIHSMVPEWGDGSYRVHWELVDSVWNSGTWWIYESMVFHHLAFLIRSHSSKIVPRVGLQDCNMDCLQLGAKIKIGKHIRQVNINFDRFLKLLYWKIHHALST